MAVVTQSPLRRFVQVFSFTRELSSTARTYFCIHFSLSLEVQGKYDKPSSKTQPPSGGNVDLAGIQIFAGQAEKNFGTDLASKFIQTTIIRKIKQFLQIT
jgi:hypothetical protein